MTEHAHLDASLPTEDRVELLLQEMTVLEQAYQLTAVAPWYLAAPTGGDPEDVDHWLARNPGHISNLVTDDPLATADLVTRIQRASTERTRLGIPVLIHSEALNGFMSGGHMVFPTGIGLASTWSPDLVQEMADLIRRQMRRLGIRQALSPNMDVALDPRWGRVHESYGEDPYLAAAFSVAYASGLQGPDLADGVIATGKHFVGYGKPEGGINLGATEIGWRTLRDLFCFPFEAAIHEAGMASVMNSYSDIDGVPVGASREVLTTLLRDTLQFEGFVTSDYTTLDHFVDRQRVAADAAEAGRLALVAGLDTENPLPFGYGDVLAEGVDRGEVPLELLRTSVRRILTAKFELGLFENPYPSESIDVRSIAEEGRELSEELARRSVILLGNDGILPLRPGAQSVALVGPHADAVDLQFPTYTFPAFREMTLFMSRGGFGGAVGVDPGMAAWNAKILPDQATSELVRERYGATSLAEVLRGDAADLVVEPATTLRDELDGGLERAVAAAEDAEVVVLALGGASLWFTGERTEGEASDSADIALPAAQVRLAEAIAALGKPMVVVLVQGRAYTLPPAVREAAATVVLPYGGPFGPQAVADVLFGRVNPSGKLPYSIPLHPGQVPVYHHQKAGTGRRIGLPPGVPDLYLDSSAEPLHAFGHGLSYTEFALSELEVSEQADTTGSFQVSVNVSNMGDRDGATTVQLYLRANTSGVTRPAQQLAGIARVELAVTESQRVTFSLDSSQLGYTNMAREFAVEPCRVDVMVGFDADRHDLCASLDLVGERAVLTARERSFLTKVHYEEIS
ncbi:beta-glucosidase [Tessaracoccus rhinocerotis]|uniref:Beta-glucosidase n=1 Tax=Tessaracoccus rhinocerotis TaxID=1689449 RepID=A0A553JZ35_9ACTN|nr:glycoside hydrolase family 3 N-terminal domain-containing protein [Tessaracoccus rhinocerotis]TRY17703.1 beta-glucosidase [Tessaracoccus rhinocerotis]